MMDGALVPLRVGYVLALGEGLADALCKLALLRVRCVGEPLLGFGQ
jgi:hypothetical protein